MSQTNITIRMDRELKQQAEKLFSELGLNMTTAITMFTKTAVREQRIPFELRIPEPKTNFSKLSVAEIDSELDKGYQEYLKGESIPAEHVFAEMHKKYGE
ncbi:MAG: type II toxin-antitoxin system RelB/DinJ family antitoxin [Clostridiales bacterium]|nr:type II toxin-antitoxin system RelB/DinJ family antitoxin [Clostridiales bacterium]